MSDRKKATMMNNYCSASSSDQPAKLSCSTTPQRWDGKGPEWHNQNATQSFDAFNWDYRYD